MRIVLVGAVPSGLGAALAAYLHLEHVQDLRDVAGDGFVLEGEPTDIAGAQALDMLLRRRGADVSAVLCERGGHLSPQAESVLNYFRGRVVEFDPNEDPFDSALAGLREAMLSR